MSDITFERVKKESVSCYMRYCNMYGTNVPVTEYIPIRSMEKKFLNPVSGLKEGSLTNIAVFHPSPKLVDQLPRLGKRELICLLLFTCNYVISVWRGFLYL